MKKDEKVVRAAVTRRLQAKSSHFALVMMDIWEIAGNGSFAIVFISEKFVGIFANNYKN